MTQPIRKEQVKKLVGKQIVAVRKDGTVVTGKLVKIQGRQLFVEPVKGKKVRTKAVIPLVLFDLLAIGTAPFGFGFGPGFGFGGPGIGFGGPGINSPYYGYGSGVGYPGGFW